MAGTSPTRSNTNLPVLACSRALEAESVDRLPGFRLVRLPCSSKAEHDLVMNAFLGGAGGVAVIPCPLGACQYVEGNRRADALAKGAASLLKELGLSTERFAIYPLELESRIGIPEFLDEFKGRVEGLDGNRVEGLDGSRVEGLDGNRVEGLDGNRVEELD